MPQAIYLDTGDYFEDTAATALDCGDLVFDDMGRCGVITDLNGIASGAKFRAQCTGRYKITAKSSDEWAAGARLFWDSSNEYLTITSSGNSFVGYATVAKASSETTNIVVLKSQDNDLFIPPAASDSLSGAGAISVTSYLTKWTTTSADAGTLADGTRVGQLKKIQLIVDGGDGTLTPSNLSGGTTITFADAGDVAVLLWNGSDWVAIELTNDADGATGPVLA